MQREKQTVYLLLDVAVLGCEGWHLPRAEALVQPNHNATTSKPRRVKCGVIRVVLGVMLHTKVERDDLHVRCATAGHTRGIPPDNGSVAVIPVRELRIGLDLER